MNRSLELAQNKFIGSLGKLCDSIGFNKQLAQIYALLYLSEKPLSLDDIMAVLKVSKGCVSINIRELEGWGAVRSVWIKGSRKDYYEADLDIKKLILTRAKSSIQKRLNMVNSMIEEFDGIMDSAEELNKDEEGTAKVYKKRVEKIKELKNLAASAISIADKLL